MTNPPSVPPIITPLFGVGDENGDEGEEEDGNVSVVDFEGV